MWKLPALAALVAGVASGPSARAQAAPATSATSAAAAEAEDADVTARLAWLERVLEREGSATGTWHGGWLGFYGAATLFEGALLAVASSPVDRVGDGVNLAKSAIAFGFTLLSPVTAGPAARVLRDRPVRTAAERYAKLRLAESFLRAVAAEERDRRGWFPLIGGAALNAGGGFLTWATTKGSGGAGWFGVASGLAVAQLQFHTQPTGAIRAWDTYQRAASGSRLGEPPAVLRWSITPTAGGAALRGEF